MPKGSKSEGLALLRPFDIAVLPGHGAGRDQPVIAGPEGVDRELDLHSAFQR